MRSNLLVVVCVSLLLTQRCKSKNVEIQQDSSHHKLLLISFDGFRWDFSQRTPNLEAFKYLKANGVHAKYLKSIFPTFTSPNHFSIATGLYSESHGVVHNLNYNIKDESSNATYLSTLLVNDWFDNGAEPIWIAAVNQGLKSGGYMFPGSYANISGVGATLQIPQLEIPPTPDENSWRNRVDETMKWFTDEDLDMVALYFGQPDTLSHTRGPDDEIIAKEIMPLLNRTIMYLIAKVEQYGLTDNLNIIITSDHGFEAIDTSVKGDDAISLSKYVERSYIDFQLSYGPIGLVQPKPGKEAYVKEKLQNGNRNMKVYLREELPDYLHYKNNDRVTSIVVLANPGYRIYDIFPGFHKYSGDHGYDSSLETMRTSYFSIGPSFKKNYTIEGFENVNIYPLMCHLLGLEPSPNNGSLDVLRETLITSAAKNVASSSATLSAAKSDVSPQTTENGILKELGLDNNSLLIMVAVTLFTVVLYRVLSQIGLLW